MTMPRTVSRETQDRLTVYAALLAKWQARMNLVAPDSLREAGIRHFQDSLQLLPLLPQAGRSSDLIRGFDKSLDPRVRPEGLTEGRGQVEKAVITPLLTLIDFGSGAGFPGLVLALARPDDLAVHLIESDAKKGEFLKTVSRETGVKVTVHTARIEATEPFFADVITARALASLPDLLAYALPYAALNTALRLIFLKGETWEAEVTAARALYGFDLTTHQSETHPKARVLVIENLCQKP